MKFRLLHLDDGGFRYVKILEEKYENIKDEYEAIIVAAKLLGWKVSIGRSTRYYTVYFLNSTIKKRFKMRFYVNPGFSESFSEIKIVQVVGFYEEVILSCEDLVEALKKFRRYL